MLIQREPFDYTRWQENLFADKDIETIFKEAAALRAQTEKAKPARAAKSSKKPVNHRNAAKRLTHA